MFFVSYELFSYNHYSSYIKPRHFGIWTPCLSPLKGPTPQVSCYDITSTISAPPLLPPIPSEPNTAPSLLSTLSPDSDSHPSSPTPSDSETCLLIIDTAFNPTLAVNTEVTFGKKGTNKKSPQVATRQERHQAEKALHVASYEEFSEKVLIYQTLIYLYAYQRPAYQLPLNRISGTKPLYHASLIHSRKVRMCWFLITCVFSSYVYAHRNRLRINDCEGKPLLIVCPDLPEQTREPMIRYLQVACPNQLHHTDSKVKNYKFTAYHFTWWNRYAPDVGLFLLSYHFHFFIYCIGFRSTSHSRTNNLKKGQQSKKTQRLSTSAPYFKRTQGEFV